MGNSFVTAVRLDLAVAIPLMDFLSSLQPVQVFTAFAVLAFVLINILAKYSAEGTCNFHVLLGGGLALRHMHRCSAHFLQLHGLHGMFSS